MAHSDGEGLVVTMYAPVKVEYQTPSGAQISLNMDTTYPFNDTVKILLEGPETTALSLRIPSWAEGAYVQVNDSSPMTAEPGS